MGSRPVRLIDPDGEGVYMLVGNPGWTLRHVALDLLGNAAEWRNLDYTGTWMREDEDGNWHPTRWRWWHGLVPNKWRPTLYAYLTPKPEPDHPLNPCR